jgi:SPP1 family predicted phage head-tail adaptor
MLNSREQIGRLDRRIYIIQPVTTTGTSKGPTITGYEFIDSDYQPWARVRNKLGDEIVQNDIITHVQQTVFTIRYRTDITTEMSIVHENKRYKIFSFAESGEVRRRFLDITAEYTEDYTIT